VLDSMDEPVELSNRGSREARARRGRCRPGTRSRSGCATVDAMLFVGEHVTEPLFLCDERVADARQNPADLRSGHLGRDRRRPRRRHPKCVREPLGCLAPITVVEVAHRRWMSAWPIHAWTSTRSSSPVKSCRAFSCARRRATSSTIGTDRTLPDFGTLSSPAAYEARTRITDRGKSTSRQCSARNSPMRNPVNAAVRAHVPSARRSWDILGTSFGH
jgi:hypothetical protein